MIAPKNEKLKKPRKFKKVKAKTKEKTKSKRKPKVTKEEKIYDSQIVPLIKVLCEKCGELKFSAVTTVEWTPGKSSTSVYCSPEDEDELGATIRAMLYVAKTGGTLDDITTQFYQYAQRVGGSNSLVLKALTEQVVLLDTCKSLQTELDEAKAELVKCRATNG